MNDSLWRLGAVDLASAIRRREVSATEAVHSVLARIADVNPRLNALSEVLADGAVAAAAAADAALARGDSVGPLHGVPVTIKVNVDVQGHATTDGVVALRDNLATTDSPLVTSLRQAGAVVVGRSNTPAFSLRWFTDNDLHGRTLNPFDAGITPGGSSGGAAVAVASGMGMIAHGNDYGGSIRYPAWACGVVGLRTTVGRVPSYKASAPNRSISNQQMSVQGPLTRSVADARLALQVMARGCPLDPQWVPAPLDFPATGRPLRVAVFKRHAAFDADAGVVAAVEQAAAWLTRAGCAVEDAAPPHFEEGADLWRQLVMEDMRNGAVGVIERLGDAGVVSALHGYMDGLAPAGAGDILSALTRRFGICRDWAVFLDHYDVLLMPNSWQRQFPVDADKGSASQVQRLLAAQSPLLGTAMMGLPGLSVPTGVVDGLPTGVQVVSGRFREDLALQVGELIEQASGYRVLEALAARVAH